MLSVTLVLRVGLTAFLTAFLIGACEAMIPLKAQSACASENLQLRFSQAWHILGPFRVGTREAVWNADPLEILGGFPSLVFDANATFRSPLGANGIVSWKRLLTKPSSTIALVSVQLTVGFPETDWNSLRSFYGWAALQYQGWARGYLEVLGTSSQRVVLFTDNILELWINDIQYFGGDFYAFRRAPIVVTLYPGENKLDIRLVREIRSMGGANALVTVGLEAQIAKKTLHAITATAVVPDLVDGRLPSLLASVTVRNEAEEWIELCCSITDEITKEADFSKSERVRFAPGQSRPIIFQLRARRNNFDDLVLSFRFRKLSVKAVWEVEELTIKLNQKSLTEPHKMTFLHPSGAVSYAILRPPVDLNEQRSAERALPLLLNLHGAGLEADSHQVRHMLDSAPDLRAWVLFPTGMSPWSGDDWHTWGFADVKAAISAIPDWMKATEWTGPGVLTNKWFISGHSNGGQGTWQILSHRPDNAIAAAAVSGYLSIQNYVPYSMWREAPSQLTAITQHAMSSFRHELLTENMVDVPVLVQHGSEDDNVPPFHARLMSSLLSEVGAQSDFVELAGKGHWFKDAMTTQALRDFYRRHLSTEKDVVAPPESFQIVIPSSDDMGSRWCIVVDQLESPDIFGRIDVVRHPKEDSWQLSTFNIHRFHFEFARCQVHPPKIVVVDGYGMSLGSGLQSNPTFSLVVSAGNSWVTEDIGDWKSLQQRSGRQRGALDAIMRTNGAFSITTYSDDVFDLALQISRNFYQYFGADSAIVGREDDRVAGRGNVVTLAIGDDTPTGLLESFPIKVSKAGVEIHQLGRPKAQLIPAETGTGAIFLRPLEDERLELVVWGADKEGLKQVLRLVPTLTGVGQADFVVLSRKSGWLGHAGALAMGFFDFEWNISKASYVP